MLLGGCAGTAAYFRDAGPSPETAPIALRDWPHREIWTGVVFNGDKIGFTRRSVRAARDAPGRYEIESQAAFRLRFLGVDKRVSLRALERVRADLTLEAFRYEHDIDGSSLLVAGASDGRLLRFSVAASGSRRDHSVPLGQALYPSSALALLPALRGLAVGSRLRYAVFHAETQQVAQAEQAVLGFESSELLAAPAFRLSTRLLGVETTTWIGADGRPLLELAAGGAMISALEDEARARRYLVEAALNKRDALLDFSLLRAGPIEAPRRVSRMDIALEGVPEGFAVPSEGGQACAREGSRVRCRLDRAAPLATDDPARYLAPSLAAPSNLRQFVELASSIAGAPGDDAQKIERLVGWIDANIGKEAVDAFSALDVLRNRRAECQGHAYLLAALARALGMPARVVNGLAYSEAHRGFLYHTWNELWVEGRGWQPVDATFGQPLADATHLKLLEGETPGELAPLVGLLGKLGVASVSAAARW